MMRQDCDSIVQDVTLACDDLPAHLHATALRLSNALNALWVERMRLELHRGCSAASHMLLESSLFPPSSHFI